MFNCPVCKKSTFLKFKISHPERKYYECASCHFLFQKGKSDVNKRTYKVNTSWEIDDPGFDMRNHIMAEIIKEKIKDKNRIILDYGCGTGLLVSLLRDDGYKIYGYDPYIEKTNNKEVLSNRLKDLPVKKFDCILAVETIEHLENLKEDLRKILARLEDNGIFIFTTQFYNPKFHRENWQYLSPAHLSISSLKSIEIIARELGIKKRTVFRKQFEPHEEHQNDYVIGQIWFREANLSFCRRVFDSLIINFKARNWS